jgi:hypothetical protein
MSRDVAVIVDQGVVDGKPIVAITYLKPIGSWDSGFAAWSVPPEQDDVEGELIHGNCFAYEHPEAAPGLVLAREHGRANFSDGEWSA